MPRYLLIVAFLTLNFSSVYSESLDVRYYQHQARYVFGQELLTLALSKVNKEYRIQARSKQRENEARGETRLLQDHYDIEWLTATTERDQHLIPIHIPIFKGILGIRLLLIRYEDRKAFNKINDIQSLKNFVAGHGTHWSDTPIYSANQLPVHTNVNYSALFEQLKEKRFDYFPRGINEIWNELEAHHDSLYIADDLLIYYPLPVFFYVSPKRPQLAKDLKKGLTAALADGSYDRLFQQHHGDLLKRANITKRHVIRLNNRAFSRYKKQIQREHWLPYELGFDQ